MKIRTAFVSNSSSSSFVCEVCGITESGFDASASDFDMAECKNGHVFCLSHQPTVDLTKIAKEDWIETIDQYFPPHREWSKENNKEAREILESGDYEKLMEYIDEEDSTVPWFLCPICTMTVISEGDMKSYLKKVTGVAESEAFEEIKKENRRRRKLYDSEYNSYTAKKLGRTVAEIEKEIVAKFSPDYDKFLKFLTE